MVVPVNKKKAINSVIAELNKKFGANTVDYLSKKEDELKVRYYETPSYEVNLMLGGGVGRGKIVEFFGDPGCGKTSLAFEIIGKNMKENPEFMTGWFETEGSFDPNYIKTFGIDKDRFTYWDQTNLNAEEGFEVLRSLIGSGAYNMIVVNSISGLLTKNENENDMAKLSIGELAKLMSKLMRVITGISFKTGCSVIFINQLRDKIGVMFGDPSTTTGGRALGFFASQRIRLSKYKLEKGDPITAEEGLKIHCKVVKNRLAKGNPFKQCDYYVVYERGINNIYEIPLILERENLIRKAGSWIYYENENGEPLTIGGTVCKWNSKANFMDSIILNEELRMHLEKKIRESIATSKGVVISKEEIQEIHEEETNDIKELEKYIDKEELKDAAIDAENEPF